MLVHMAILGQYTDLVPSEQLSTDCKYFDIIYLQSFTPACSTTELAGGTSGNNPKTFPPHPSFNNPVLAKGVWQGALV